MKLIIGLHSFIDNYVFEYKIKLENSYFLKGGSIVKNIKIENKK